MEQPRIVLLVPKAHVKHVKSTLEKHNQFDRASRITPQQDHSTQDDHGQRMRIPTTIPHPSTHGEDGSQTLSALLATLALEHLTPLIALSQTTTTGLPPQEKNPLRRAVASALAALSDPILSTLDLTTAALTTAFPDAYSIYQPMLLLPAGTFSAPAWQKIIDAYPPGSPVSEQLWAHVASKMKVTHVALNSPIPLSASTTTTTTPQTTTDSEPNDENENENILRSPLHLTPLHGPWGPPPTPRSTTAPTPQDFAAATWVRTCQNGIWQVWAPRYTMFSRGNMREKTRILKLPDTAFEAGEGGKGGIAAADLYSGIGYFAFSYRMRGARVACWELNPWSIEGLRRGAALNGWTTALYPSPSSDADFLIHPTTNEHALPTLNTLRPSLPPIRHVNLGLLPLSRPTWRTALRALDVRAGGWIHAHENVGEVEMEARRAEVEGIFGRLMREWEDEESEGLSEAGRKRREVKVVHVERVKLYAPGVVHVVFDVWVEGTGWGGRVDGV
jgi:tRNA wybutosine-synthesizing protein 2